MTAAALLDRLDKVRQRGPDQWSACCPAHEDRGPSLSIKELLDGRVLLKCFAGCDVESVVGALGLSLEALFPPRAEQSGPAPRRRLITPGQALEVLEAEAGFLVQCAVLMANGDALGDESQERLLQSAAYITLIRDEVQA